MKKLFIVTIFVMGLFISPVLSQKAQADIEGKTIIAPFFQMANKVQSENKDEKIEYRVKPGDVDLLAHMVYGEARGESKEGKVAVAAVILNRTQDPKFPKDVKGVMFEPDAFTAVNDGQFFMKPDKTAYEAVDEALKGVDPTDGATFYWNPKTATSGWVWSRTVVKQIGQHLFAK